MRASWLIWLALCGLGCESPEQRAAREAWTAEQEARRSRTDCVRVDMPGECTTVVGFCPTGGVASTFHCASDQVVFVCPEDMPGVAR